MSEEARFRGMNEVSKCAFEKFVDISEVLQPSPNAKIAWCIKLTTAIFLFHSARRC